eukprot:CAMPEP_0182854950 /NCGR_PEP_ID=MMETSP0034_2-20130328/1562_1 /TAXON_ID=156128 /ORGANISM="Nephroselmis pyriformis, Strain CCMP717" /LENGTH=56 /DNA_ID=CAMNT_0024985849 /DNA_START=33 /DNA_END=200 /DNA_ORIENTATION=+
MTSPTRGMFCFSRPLMHMPRVGDVMIYKTDTTLKAVKSFTSPGMSMVWIWAVKDLT